MDIFDKVKENVNIQDVIEVFSGAEFNHRGNKLVGLCPFHQEKTPSFTVYLNGNDFYCFGCGVGGDSITFVEKYLKLTSFEAAKAIADRFNIISTDNPELSQKLEKRKKEREKELSFKETCNKEYHLVLNKKLELENLAKNGLMVSPRLVSLATRLEDYLDTLLFEGDKEKQEFMASGQIKMTLKDIQGEVNRIQGSSNEKILISSRKKHELVLER